MSISARILVAEDNNVTNRLLELRCSRSWGCAEALISGADVFMPLESVPYGLFLIHMQMPVLGGIEATHRSPKSARPGVINHDVLAIVVQSKQSDRISIALRGHPWQQALEICALWLLAWTI